jgi:hypothetical protein
MNSVNHLATNNRSAGGYWIDVDIVVVSACSSELQLIVMIEGTAGELHANWAFRPEISAYLKMGLLELGFDQGAKGSDVAQGGELVAGELYPKLLLDREHQRDVGERIPSLDISSGGSVGHTVWVNSEDVMEDLV